MLSGTELIIALAIIFVGATVMGTVGFGLGLLVSPVLLLFIDPQPVVVMANSLMAILLVLVLLHTRQHLDIRQIGTMVLGGVAAVPIGVLALDLASPATLRITIAVVLLSLAPLTVLKVRLPLATHPLSGPTIGFLTSLSVTTLSIGGPLAAIYVIAQRWPTPKMRASLALFFLSSNVVAFFLYTWAGLVDRQTLANIGVLIPCLLLGFGLATLVVRRIDPRVFGYVATTVIIVGGGVLLGREIAGL